jgi:hypothetical protein
MAYETVRSGSRSARFRHKVPDPLGELGADFGPVINAIQVKPEAFFLATGDRIEKADSLDPAAVPFVAAVRHHDVVEGTLFGAAARQSNLYHVPKPFSETICSILPTQSAVHSAFGSKTKALLWTGLRKPRILTDFAQKKTTTCSIPRALLILFPPVNTQGLPHRFRLAKLVP